MNWKNFRLNTHTWIQVNLDLLPISFDDFMLSHIIDLKNYFEVDEDGRKINELIQDDVCLDFEALRSIRAVNGTQTLIKAQNGFFGTSETWAVKFEDNGYSHKIIIIGLEGDDLDLSPANPISIFYPFLEKLDTTFADGFRVLKFYDNIFFIQNDYSNEFQYTIVYGAERISGTIHMIKEKIKSFRSGDFLNDLLNS